MKQKKACKIKLVKILEILRQDSDEEHYIDTAEILNKLATAGIECDRRTLYNDIDVLNDYGYEVLCAKQSGKANRYCVADRSFDVPELRILIDAIQAASFVTCTKSKQLIEKVAALGGSHRAELLKNNVLWLNTAKHTNEHIYYIVDVLDRAISQGKKISFFYFGYDSQGNKVYRKEKKRYIENPYALVFFNGNYYLVSYNEKHDTMLHYRVDRMDNVAVEEADQAMPLWASDFDLTTHMNQVFGMYSGQEKTVTILVQNTLITAVMDKFGETVSFDEQGNGWSKATVTVQVSPQFYSWCCAFPDTMKILAPQEVVDGMREHITLLVAQYAKEADTATS